jgi:hypothetical protein
MRATRSIHLTLFDFTTKYNKYTKYNSRRSSLSNSPPPRCGFSPCCFRKTKDQVKSTAFKTTGKCCCLTRRLGLSQRSPGFALRSVYVGMWWIKWHWDRFLSEFFHFPCQYHSTVALHTDISPEG